MFNFIRNHQMNIMLCLCAVCVTMAVLLFITRFLPKRRKWILIAMEILATLLLAFDRLAYIYSGKLTTSGYVLVRLSNFMVFFLTSGIVFNFNLYIIDLLTSEVKLQAVPKRLTFAGIASVIGMLLIILNVFTGIFYTFDSFNYYHRGPFFILSYIVPVLCPLLQFTVIYKYRKSLSPFIYYALVLYIFGPIITGIIQIFAYGISIVNMAMVLVSVFLYIFTYLDVNDEVENAHKIEMQGLKDEQESIRRFFKETASAFVNSMEKSDQTLKGHAERVADLAQIIAEENGLSDEDCEKAYYAAFLHNVGEDILSGIKEYPYLSETVHFINERYDGKGNTKGAKGKEIPVLARIITVAKAYDTLTNVNNKNPLPKFFIREEFIREAGTKYDPDFANTMVMLMDEETNSDSNHSEKSLEKEITCKSYREHITLGIPVLQNIGSISFKSSPLDSTAAFSSPSIVLYDSYDALVHDAQEEIDTYHYFEYGEIWFDSNIICTSARNMEVRNLVKKDAAANSSENDNSFKITSSRFEDHVLIKMESSSLSFDVIIALPSISKACFIGITGENCQITEINCQSSEKTVGENDIPRIAEKLSYINGLESDLPNVQIDSPMSAFTEAVEIKEKLKLIFHTKSLPEANLVWHCAYILLFYSDDKKVYGKNYREYAMVKLNGEDNANKQFSENLFKMHKTDEFTTWAEWEKENKKGFESTVEFEKNGNTIRFFTRNKGIALENICTLKDSPETVYVCLTGDQVALTDIRIK